MPAKCQTVSFSPKIFGRNCPKMGGGDEMGLERIKQKDENE